MQELIAEIQSFFQMIFSGDLRGLVESVGLFGVWAIVFAESGLLIGFFLPGDSLLFTAGLLGSPAFDFFNVWVLLIGAWIAAIVGDNVGYEFGKHAGRGLFKREKSFLFNPKNLLKAQEFYDRHGGKAITLARFVPVVRTFAPIIAGISHMDHKKFMIYNTLGATLWVWGMVWLGYFLGQVIPDVDKYILPIVMLIIVISVIPPFIHLVKEKRREKKGLPQDDLTVGPL